MRYLLRAILLLILLICLPTRAANFSAEISTSDQPGPPVTATFEKIGDYIREYDLGSEVFTLASD
jgi:hypothetical protein